MSLGLVFPANSFTNSLTFIAAWWMAEQIFYFLSPSKCLLSQNACKWYCVLYLILFFTSPFLTYMLKIGLSLSTPTKNLHLSFAIHVVMWTCTLLTEVLHWTSGCANTTFYPPLSRWQTSTFTPVPHHHKHAVINKHHCAFPLWTYVIISFG